MTFKKISLFLKKCLDYVSKKYSKVSAYVQISNAVGLEMQGKRVRMGDRSTEIVISTFTSTLFIYIS